MQKNENDEFFENLYNSIVGKFEENSESYRVTKSCCCEETTAEVIILPKGFKETLNGIQNRKYLDTLTLKFNDLAQYFKIRIKRDEKESLSYVALTVYSKTAYVVITDIGEKAERWNTLKDKIIKEFLIYDNENILTVKQKAASSYYPTTVSDFRCVPTEVSEIVFPLYSKGSMIWKDFLAESFFPPIKLNALPEFHNKREFFENQFNIQLPKSVNRLPFLKTYAICCAKDYIKREQFSILLSDMNDIGFSFLPSKRNKKEIAAKYLKEYLLRKNKTANESVITDYIDFSLTLKKPVDIRAGKRKISEYHGTLTDRMILKASYGKKLIIPETPLKYLKLPKEFTLLSTKKSLVFEGQRNHNCVGGYVEYINKGKCIVYSADIDGEHLTIDIRHRKSRKKDKEYEFQVRQCYTSYNGPCKPETLQYVRKCVEDASDAAIKRYNSSKAKKESHGKKSIVKKNKKQ